MNYLLTENDLEYYFELKYGYDYNVNFDFKECILCTPDVKFMKIR